MPFGGVVTKENDFALLKPITNLIKGKKVKMTPKQREKSDYELAGLVVGSAIGFSFAGPSGLMSIGTVGYYGGHKLAENKEKLKRRHIEIRDSDRMSAYNNMSRMR